VGTCSACGGIGQPCCINGCTDLLALCGTDGLCTSACGGVGQPCCQAGCAANAICVQGGSSNNFGNECIAAMACDAQAGQCTTCGANGTPCCSGTLCQVGQCIPAADGGSPTCLQRMGP
jgi:hypothetical protein